MSSALPPVKLCVVTREVDPGTVEELLELTSPRDPLVWSRRGDVMVGGSAVAEMTASTAAEAARWWRGVCDNAEVDDPVGLPGTGLVAFGALPFDARSGRSGTLRVPEVLIGRRGGHAWITHVGLGSAPTADAPRPTPFGAHWAPTLGPGTLTPEGYQAAVRAGLDAIAAGEVEKVVLARDIAGTVPPGADLRRLVRALSTAYPDTWTYAVDGLIGASPETLVTVAGGTVTARVLAGTTARGADADADTAASLALATSVKDLDEHEYAVQSVLRSLRPHTSALVAAEEPFTLKLPNVWHLATDVEGTLSDAASALDLLGALHPTAAVAGTPTQVAMDVIRRLEPFDRGLYAGPVGWIDAAGDGEWAIALRCAQFDLSAIPPGGRDDIPFTAHAGAGIVAGSDPETEMLETRVKFRPIVDALA
ncbi:isochorismate synthase [Microbacterium sp. bgisy189]|uniref:isochorismate synthase n=1 Tax=Microbacterium sp. bgisy189 TaxID=3413798 RepID=UPI003EB9F971